MRYPLLVNMPCLPVCTPGINTCTEALSVSTYFAMTSIAVSTISPIASNNDLKNPPSLERFFSIEFFLGRCTGIEPVTTVPQTIVITNSLTLPYMVQQIGFEPILFTARVTHLQCACFTVCIPLHIVVACMAFMAARTPTSSTITRVSTVSYRPP